jgi:hypothetical protein
VVITGRCSGLQSGPRQYSPGNYNEHIGAVAAIVAQHLEKALTRRFGLEWVARDDGHGFEAAARPHARRHERVFLVLGVAPAKG